MLNAGQRSYVPATPDCLVPIIPFLATAMTLHSKTLFITGASRGIGLAIALRAARDGANIVVAAKTVESHPNLPGTIYTAAEEIGRAGGTALPLIVDVRDEGSVVRAFDEAVQRFGGIDILVNNASAISLNSSGRFESTFSSTASMKISTVLLRKRDRSFSFLNTASPSL